MRIELASAIALALMAFGAAVPSAEKSASAGVEMVRLADGRRLAVRCSGRGSPTVILEAGFAGSSLGWSRVQSRVQYFTRVCSYDRAGYGLSDPGPFPRDGAAVTADLAGALRAARVRGPFILVGHSAGGLYMRLFAATRPEEVVGMVLVDPSIEHQDARLAAVFGAGAGDLRGQRRRALKCAEAAEAGAAADDPAVAECVDRRTGAISPAYVWRTQLSEIDTLWSATSDQVDRIGVRLRRIPLIVLSAQREGDGSQMDRLAGEVWTGFHREIAAASAAGEVRPVRSSHMIMVDQPDAVVDAIKSVMRAAEKHPRR